MMMMTMTMMMMMMMMILKFKERHFPLAQWRFTRNLLKKLNIENSENVKHR